MLSTTRTFGNNDPVSETITTGFEASNTVQDVLTSDLSNLIVRTDTIEEENRQQNTSISNLQVAVNAFEINTSSALNALDSTNSTQASQINSLQSGVEVHSNDILAIQVVNSAQTVAISAIEAINSMQAIDIATNTTSIAAIEEKDVLKDTLIAANSSAIIGLQELNVSNASITFTNQIESVGTSMSIGRQPHTESISIGTGQAVQVVNIGTGSGATTINIGAAGDTVAIAGTLTTVDTANISVTDHLITLNKGGLSGSSYCSGIEIEENGQIAAYAQTCADRTRWQFKAANNPSVMSLNQSVATYDDTSFNSVTVPSLKLKGSVNGLSTTIVANPNTQPYALTMPANNTAGVLTNDGSGLLTFVIPSTNAATVTTNANLTGEVTSVGNTTTINNEAVINKTLTGFSSVTGVVTNTDSIISGLNKVTGNLAALTNVVGIPTTLNVADQIVKRDANGNIAVSTATMTSATVSGDIVVDGKLKKSAGQTFLNIDAIGNSLVGLSSGVAITTGVSNTIIGNVAASTLSIGSGNTVIGTGGCTSLISGTNNVSLGASTTILDTGYTAPCSNKNNILLGSNSQPLASLTNASGASFNATCGQLVLGSSTIPIITATRASQGARGTVPTNVANYLVAIINGVQYRIPLFLP